ncbi:MAG: VOC family protein [Actinomycetes bacterium]
MGVSRLNHAVLYVRDLDVSAAFYHEVLGFEVVERLADQAAFLRAPDSTNDHDLGLFRMGEAAGPSGAGRTTVGLYHLAWEVSTLGDLEELQQTLAERGALAGASDHGTTKSLYGRDPDGIEFEVVWLIPAHLLTPEDRGMAIKRLDLPREIARYGRETRSGLGVSVPLGVSV